MQRKITPDEFPVLYSDVQSLVACFKATVGTSTKFSYFDIPKYIKFIVCAFPLLSSIVKEVRD